MAPHPAEAVWPNCTRCNWCAGITRWHAAIFAVLCSANAPFAEQSVCHVCRRGLADMRTPLAITVGANVINLALDPILIFGLHWDVRGAAAATAAAEWTSAAAYLTLMWRRREQLGGRVLHCCLQQGSLARRA